MLKKLKEKRPDEVNIIKINDDGSMIAHLPFKWMSIKPKVVRNYTDEQRREIAARLSASKGKI